MRVHRLLPVGLVLTALVAAGLPAAASDRTSAREPMQQLAVEPTDGPTSEPTAGPTPGPTPEPTPEPSEVPVPEPTQPPSQAQPTPQEPGTVVGGIFTGIDGNRYPASPSEVVGVDGVSFFGTDLDLACGLGARTTESWKQLAQLAKVITKSGRRVIWTVAPSKATVLTRLLDPATLPHGACDVAGLDAARLAMDSYRSPGFVHVRKQLSTSTRQVYFDTDPHWTTVGSSLFARAVARRLDPKLAARQHYRYGSLSFDDTLLQPETAETAAPDGRVTVRNSGSSTSKWKGYPDIVYGNAWNSLPPRRTWPGETLLLGDSFMYYALGAMRPMFAHGSFVWAAHAGRKATIAAIQRSDTVVMESLQTFVPLGQTLSSASFRKKLKKSLAPSRTPTKSTSKPTSKSTDE